MSFPESITVILDSNGDGTIRFAQVPPYRMRSYHQVAVHISTGDASFGGEAKMYRGDPIPSNFLTGTITPWSDNSIVPEIASTVLEAGLQLTLQFTDCDPNAIATVTGIYTEERVRQKANR